LGTGDGNATRPKLLPVAVSSQCTKGERIRYQQTGEFHFFTFSSFRRHALFHIDSLSVLEYHHSGPHSSMEVFAGLEKVWNTAQLTLEDL
jgi:hypothetical protein